MNYRHAYHAGNFADVFKHVVVTRIVQYLKRKDKAFRVIDTHAGTGLYSLGGIEASKTDEWRGGVGRLLASEMPADAADLLEAYLDIVRTENLARGAVDDGALAFYPGSPLLIRRLLRRQDRLSAIELHPEDAATLAALFAGDHQVRAIRLDGWLALGAHLPPKENRGLVLVDPPFEQAAEFDRMTSGLIKAHRRFPGGTYALWYPVKDRREVTDFAEALRQAAIPKTLRIEFGTARPATTGRLSACGMIVVNPPFTLEEELRTLLPVLVKVLQEGSGAYWAIEWLRNG